MSSGIPAALLRYRVMAYVVGVSIFVLILIGVPLKHLTATGSTLQRIGEDITLYLGTAHGFLYMIFLVAALDLARRCRWSVLFTAATLLMGTVPVLSFFGEWQAEQRVRAQLASEPTGDKIERTTR